MIRQVPTAPWRDADRRAAPDPRGWLALSALLLLPCLGAAAPEHAASGADARERIAAERRTAEARFSQAQAACEGRFLLTQCLDAARSERRTALERLQKQQLEIDDAARRERAAQKRQVLQSRDSGPAAPPRPRREASAAASAAESAAASAATSAPAAAAAASAPVRHRAVVPARSASVAVGPGVSPAPVPSSAQRAQKNQTDYLRRQHEAQAHREAVQERNARQDAQRPPAAGLPVPPAAPASR